MAKLFFDANYFIHFDEVSSISLVDLFAKHNLYLSTLSCHIYSYINKIKIPNKVYLDVVNSFSLVSLTNEILKRALVGPTNDLEDNIQLHSAVEAECDYFLTNDEDLLKMKFFGKTRIASTI